MLLEGGLAIMDCLQRIEILLLFRLHVFKYGVFLGWSQALKISKIHNIWTTFLIVFGRFHDDFYFVFIAFKIGLTEFVNLSITYISYLSDLILLLFRLIVKQIVFRVFVTLHLIFNFVSWGQSGLRPPLLVRCFLYSDRF